MLGYHNFVIPRIQDTDIPTLILLDYYTIFKIEFPQAGLLQSLYFQKIIDITASYVFAAMIDDAIF